MACTRRPFWPLGKRASSSPADFLHLSRINIERICELVRLENPLNPLQCSIISSKLRATIDNIKGLSPLLDDASLFNGSVALENFYRVSEKARRLVESCCRVDWCQASAFQIQNEEAFREILLETSLSYNSICQLSEEINELVLLLDFCDSSTFDPPSVEEVFQDRVALRDRLKGLVNVSNKSTENILTQHLGQYLLGRVNFALQHSPSEDLDVMSFNLWSDGMGPNNEWSKESEYLGGSVIKTTWLGITCAKKLFLDTVSEDEWLREAMILVHLNHPNIVKFLCCNDYENIHTKGHFIAMELMETSLASFIRRFKERGVQLPLFSALDIMLQIGYGMCYLHDIGVAHRDLKTSNVLVCSINAPHLQNYLEVKIVDFSIAKVKLSQDKSNTISHPRIGTTLYMAPEAFSNGRANWFKADVYSFSVMCSVILSGEEPFQDIRRGDLYAAIRSGQRPNLPVDTPKELVSVISEGWAMDRDLRPSFLDICIRLEKLRHRLLRGHYLHSLGLRLKGKYGVEYSGVKYTGDLYVKEMMEKRSEVRRLDPSHSRLQVAMNLTTEEEWFHGDEVEERPRSVQSQQQLLRGRVFQEEISIRIGATEDGGSGIDGSSSSGGLQVSSCGKIGGGVDSPQDVGITLNMSSASQSRPIPSDRETVESFNTSPPLNTSPVVSQGSGIGPPMDYFKEASSSIKLIQELTSGHQVQLHLRQCRYLSFKTSETGSFLKAKANSLVCITSGDDIRRKTLRQLHFAVKRAEKLVRSCCCEVESSWLESAVTLSQIKEDIVDILLDLRWWTSMVDIAVASVTWVKSRREIELELLELAEKDFQELLHELQSPSNELDEAVAKDKEQLLRRVREFLSSYSGKRRDHEYLLATHVRTRLENTDFVQPVANVDLNAHEVMGLIGMGGFGAVMNVTWLGRSCALKTLNYKCMHEAKSLSTFQHPHIVQFFRYWEAPVLSNSGKCTPWSTLSRISTSKESFTSSRSVSVALPELSWIAQSNILMELMPMDLARHMHYLGTSAMPQDVAIDAMLQVTKAMWHLNNYNVAHRDLKPSNVLVEPVIPQEVPELAALGYVRVKLGDFGLVDTKAMSMVNTTVSKNVGTRIYGAPEVFIQDSPFPKESPTFPRLADVWSFGIMCSEVLSGRTPFLAELQTHNMGDMHTRIQKGLRPSLPANCPDYLKFCITSCWQLRPLDRPNFADLWKLLRFAQVRSLGLIREDHELFTFTTRDGIVKRLHGKDPKLSSLWLHLRRITFPFPRRRNPSTEAIQNSNRKQSRAGSSKTKSESKPLGYLVNPTVAQDATSGSTKADVIFFEGNGGRRKYLSWKDPWVQRGQPDVWWPRDWLSKDFKGDIRVLVLEYSIAEAGIEGVVDELLRLLVFSGRWSRERTWNRPIVLVGHSLGCVVIEQLVVALNRRTKLIGSFKDDVLANRAKIAKAFLANLAGCFFYAPPFPGLVPTKDLLKYGFGGLSYSHRLFANPCLDSSQLQEPSEQFMQATSECVKLMALIEGSHTGKRTVVPSPSMQRFKDCGGRVEELINSNHSDTCKPTNKHDPSYQHLFSFIKEILNERQVMSSTMVVKLSSNPDMF